MSNPQPNNLCYDWRDEAVKATVLGVFAAHLGHQVTPKEIAQAIKASGERFVEGYIHERALDKALAWLANLNPHKAELGREETP